MSFPTHWLGHLVANLRVLRVDHGVVVPFGAVLGQHLPALVVGVEEAVSPLLAPHVAGSLVEVGDSLLNGLRIAGPGWNSHRFVQEGNQLA